MKDFFKRITEKIIGKQARLHDADKPLLIAVGIIIIFGLVMMFSATSVVSFQTKFGDSYYFFKRQLLFFSLGFFVFWFFANFNYQRLKKYSFIMLIVSLILLVVVFIPSFFGSSGNSNSLPENNIKSVSSHGAKSWINVFGMSLQPSEFVKLFFLIYLSAWFAAKKIGRREDHLHVSEKTKPFFIIFSIIAGLMLAQPDLGTLFIITISSFTVYYVGGGKMKHILNLAAVGLVCLVIVVFTKEYQQYRFRCMVDSSFSPREHCYQLNQSLIAVGSGGFFGRGLGESRQKFLYLPELEHDFIFSIISEETGFVFSSFLIFLFLFFFYRSYVIAKRTSDDFGKNLAIGIGTWISIQAILNMGGVIGILPMTGVPLPFISSGGSAVWSCLMALGILVNISKQTKSIGN